MIVQMKKGPILPSLPAEGSQEEQFLKHRYRFAGAPYNREHHRVLTEWVAFKRWNSHQSKPPGA